MSEPQSDKEVKEPKERSIFDLRRVQEMLSRGETSLPEALLIMTYMNMMEGQRQPQMEALLSQLGSQKEKLGISEALVMSAFLQQQGRPQVDVSKAVEDAVSKVRGEYEKQLAEIKSLIVGRRVEETEARADRAERRLKELEEARTTEQYIASKVKEQVAPIQAELEKSLGALNDRLKGYPPRRGGA